MGRPALLHDVVQGFAAPAPKAREQNVTAGGSTHEGFEDLFLAHYARITAVLRRMLGDSGRAEDLANAWSYVRSHRDEIDDQIKANESD